MSAPPVPVAVDVSGGRGGIVANREVIQGLARLFATVRTGLEDDTWRAIRVGAAALDDPAGVLDPLGAADVTSAAARATAALNLAADGCRELSTTLWCAAAGYRWEGGSGLWGSLWGGVERIVDDSSVTLGTLVTTGSGSAALDRLDELDPGVGDDLVDLLGTVRVGLALGLLQDDGHGTATDTGLDTAPEAARPPRSLGDLVTALARRDDAKDPGSVDVRIVVHADGTRSVVVDITGTRSWSQHTGTDPTDLTTNELAIVGHGTAYEQGVLAAMRSAGVRRDDQVMIVGHSQGGMIAVNLARDVVRRGEYHVTHVVTCGSPISLTVGAMPASVRVLALENTVDAVPRLDGEAGNPDHPNVTTVRARVANGSVGADHHLRTAYVPIARATDHDTSVSVRDFLHSADPFLTGRSVSTHTYRVTRGR